MSPKAELYLENIKAQERRGFVLRQFAFALSFLVIFCVFWSLKLTGIGIAGEAFCGMEEHSHSEECLASGCEISEHIHVESCYSDINADLENSDDWEASFGDMVRGPTVKENVVLLAKSQLGYKESELNFEVDENGVRHGITRYGQWYGNPYGDWSAMFALFCLDYAGAERVPMNGGAEALRLEWESAKMYAAADEKGPEEGNLVFVKGEGDAASSVGIITSWNTESVTAIFGDVENSVSERTLSRADGEILGYGLVPEGDTVILLAEPEVRAPSCTVWLDGTDGGIGYLSGSPNTAYSTSVGATLSLPETWTSPGKYSYKLRGWYDITNSKYYPAGAEMIVPGDCVLYADWVANSYDIGVFNAKVAETVSTNAFITTHMFDYNYLFNLHSARASTKNVSGSSHSETWSMVTSGTVPHQSASTLNFIFADNDSEGRLTMPNSRSDQNRYHDATTVTSGIYNENLGKILFDPANGFNPATGEGVLGKTYLGTGDHLFQLMQNKDDEHYGYYYYDSKHNAASFNQSAGRFYVYEYLSATSDSIGGAYADFIPLNSPYVNTNGKTVGTYNYNGVDGEYNGVTHYRFDSKYNSGNHNAQNNVYTDYAYGMRSDLQFYLPNDPGTGGNKDINGNDLEFYFSGDDDLWVLVDGKVVLDIGGIHQAVTGIIDFSNGVVTVNGKNQTSLMDLGIKAGDHTLTVLYLERGASMSNCSIYFNIAPRYGLELQKEDVLTQEVLNGATFTVYDDFECTKPSELWESEDAYNQDRTDGVLDAVKSSFEVKNGVAKMWGLGAGVTYYIKETGPPDKEGYSVAEGVIKITIEKEGYATYQVEVVEDADGNKPSNGFTVHGTNIDEEIKTVFIVVTNAPEEVKETTTVQVIKKWEDKKDHSEDYIEAYLTVTDSDGAKRRIRSITLSDENSWNYIWTNLPKKDYDTGQDVIYGIEESYESGYYSTVRRVTQIEISSTEWGEAMSFEQGEAYILGTSRGYLSTTSASNGNFIWVDEATAKESPLALWTASISNDKVKFTNGEGQILTFNNGTGSSNRYFYATKSSSSYQNFTPVNASSGFRLYVTRSYSNYYISSSNINSSGRLPSTTSASSGVIITPLTKVTKSSVQEVKDWAYQITNTPLPENNETSLTVKKEWDIPAGYDETLYQEYSVTVQLLANGVPTGRSITLSLKNNWQGAFLGLPHKDENGNVITYTAKELWEKPRWTASYGEVVSSGSSPPTYSVTIVNSYHPGGPILPSTGSAARLVYIISGSVLMLGSLLCLFVSKRRRERRME